MELKTCEYNKLKTNNNHLENMEKVKEKNDKQDKTNKLLPCTNNKFILITSFFIYLIFIYLFCKKIYFNTKPKPKINENIIIKSKTKTNDNYYNNTNLNYIERLLKTLKPNNSYKGPIFPEDGKITKEWMLNLINFMKDPKNIKTYEEKYIDKINLLKMLIAAKKIFFEQQEALIDISIPKGKNFTVVGDIHGQFYDLLNIFEINGYPSENNLYLFNGDFVDRGVFGIECIITLIGFKILYPDYFYMSRGNHEDAGINARYGFRNEVLDKYKDEKIFDCFSEFYKFLPLGHILNNEILVIHGGLVNKKDITLDELKKINRFQDIPRKGLMCDLLWSDPRDEKGIKPSRRGAGINFGPDVTEKFLKENNLKLLIRPHEVRMEGYEIEHGGKLITVFSAPNYCVRSGNKGALIKFKGGDMNPDFIKFNASPHPDISIYKYIYG